MESCLAKVLELRYQPVAVLLRDEKPAGALQGKEGQWSCIIPLFIAAAKGRTAVFERQTTVCLGGKAGLGFGQFPNYPGGIEYFLSVGKEGLFGGEGYLQTPELGRDFVECLPITDLPVPYVVFKPLSEVTAAEAPPVLVVFYVNVDQLSALAVLTNYSRPGIENVLLPFGSGCQSVFLIPYGETKKDNPRAVVGLTDITVRPMVAPDMLSFAVPYAMFRELEDNVPGSFLEKPAWQKVLTRLK